MSNLVEVISATLVAEITRIAYYLTKPFIKKRIWLLCETETQAQENGYELYLWLKNHAGAIDAYYVIDKNSPSIGKFDTREEWLALGSFKQLFYMYHAEAIISTHGLWMLPNELGILKKLTLKTLQAKRVMLGHGIGFLKNGKDFYHKSVFSLNDLFVAASPKEKDIFVNEYDYHDDEVAITGYPRFDIMTDLSEKSQWQNLIVYMPTFRDKEQHLGAGFKETDLYKNTQSMLCSESIKNSLEKNNAHIAIYLHQNIQHYSQYFDEYSSDRIHVIRQGEFTVTQLLRMGKLLITDYSSVVFDFVYMKKPFISYQFDYDKFIEARKHKAFIDIKTDLPGYVVNGINELEDTIETVFSNCFSLQPEHQKKMEKYFSFQDQDNCQRVFQAITTRL
ncbi:MAG: CDP-glycerol glycerophosphotransferase family protein [Motiliproteus sp.]